MRKLPTVLVALFIAITLTRVAAYADQEMGAGFLGWVFSAGLGVAIYVSSYWAKESATYNGAETEKSKQARKLATMSLFVFIIVDGIFNIAEVNRHVGRWTVPAAIYGAFPTVAAALLGALQSRIDALPEYSTAGKKRTNRILNALTAKIERIMRTDAKAETHNTKPKAHDAKPNAPDPKPKLQICGECGERYEGNAGSHTRWHCKARISGNGHKKEKIKV